jgi:hypothetical protein
VRGIGSGCEIDSAREEGHDTNCIKYRRSARLQPLESPARGCSGSKFFCAPGPAVQGRGGGKRVKTLSLQEPGSGQIQCTSRRDHTPFSTSTFIDIHASEQACSISVSNVSRQTHKTGERDVSKAISVSERVL